MTRAAERRFFLWSTIALLVTVGFGFARTFYLKSYFPAAPAPPEPFFAIHGTFFSAWFVLLVVQAVLVSGRRLSWHKTLGWVGTGLGVAMLVTGAAAALLAAVRPTGFMGVPMAPEHFLVLPLSALALFAAFSGLAIVGRHDLQSHKRYMLLASVSMVDAAVSRWPIDGLGDSSFVPGLFVNEVVTLGFLAPLVVWDVASRGQVHRATLAGVVGISAAYFVRLPLGSTEAWQTVARALMALAD